MNRPGFPGTVLVESGLQDRVNGCEDALSPPLRYLATDKPIQDAFPAELSAGQSGRLLADQVDRFGLRFLARLRYLTFYNPNRSINRRMLLGCTPKFRDGHLSPNQSRGS